MSCDWDVYCADCKEESGISDANHREDLMELLIKHRNALADMAELPVDQLQIDFVYVNASFFAKHRGHTLRARNEYGEFSTMCKAKFVCNCCGEVECSRLEHADASQARHYHVKEGDSCVHWETETAL